MRLARIAAIAAATAACGDILGMRDLGVAAGPGAAVAEAGAEPDPAPRPVEAGAPDATTPEPAVDAGVDAALPFDVSGTWRGKFEVASGFPGIKFTGNGVGTLVQTGRRVTGDITVSNSCINAATVEALVEPTRDFAGTIAVGGTVEVAIKGTIAPTIGTLEGTFEVKRGEGAGCTTGQVGTFLVNRD